MVIKPTCEEIEQQIMESDEELINCKQTTGALQESEDRFQRLFEQSNDAIIVHKSDRIIGMECFLI